MGLHHSKSLGSKGKTRRELESATQRMPQLVRGALNGFKLLRTELTVRASIPDVCIYNGMFEQDMSNPAHNLSRPSNLHILEELRLQNRLPVVPSYYDSHKCHCCVASPSVHRDWKRRSLLLSRIHSEQA